MTDFPTGPGKLRRFTTCGWLVVGICCVPGCGRSPTTPNGPPAVGGPPAGESHFQFVEIASASGVSFIYRNGEDAGHFSILESLGGGVALSDVDNDDALDLVIAGGGEFEGERLRGAPPALFRATGTWAFSPVTDSARVDVAPYYSHGVHAADYDNDGFADLVVTGYGGLVLFHNQGDGTFDECTATAALDDELWSSSAAWGDVNGDGNLDLYVAHYANWSFENHPSCGGEEPDTREICPPRQFDPLPDTFYFSRGEGSFVDASAEVGLRSDGKGLGVVFADLDLDGRIDLYVGNDNVANFLYRNEGVGFVESGFISGTAFGENGSPEGSMGVDVADYNSDGLPDVWVANYERETFALYKNLGDCFFQHVSRQTRVSALGGLYVGWGTAFVDLDRDGDEDILATNGHVIRHPKNAPLRQQPLLLENHEGEWFEHVNGGPYFEQSHMGRGLAVGDLDNDGDVDAVCVPINEPVSLLRNESRNDLAWIGLRLIGTRSNRDAVGCLITLVGVDGGRQYRQVKGGGSYASTNDRRVWFGLGADTTVDRIEIRWPAGTRQVLAGPVARQIHTLVEPLNP